MKNNQTQKGFTLIEVLIVAGIVALLAALAYPSYMSSIRKSNRAEAKAGLTDVAQQLQRCYTAYSKFNDPKCSVYTALTGTNKITTQSSGYYEITFAASPAVTATTYTLSAKPVRSPQTNDNDCKEFTVNQTGQRVAKDSGNNISSDKCW